MTTMLGRPALLLLLSFFCCLVFTTTTTRAIILRYDVTPNVHWPLAPSLRWDLLAALQMYSSHLVDRDLSAHWAPWMFADERQRLTILETLGGQWPSPLASNVESAPAILNLPIQLRPSLEKRPWLALQCSNNNNNNNNADACQRHLIALGHPDSDFPLGLGGYQIGNSTALDLSATSSVWREHVHATMRLRSAALLWDGIKLLYERSDENDLTTMTTMTTYWHDKRDALHYRNYLKYVVEYDNDNTTDAWCFDGSSSSSSSGGGTSDIIMPLQKHTPATLSCRRVCLSATLRHNRIYTNVNTFGRSSLLLQLSERYVFLHPPFDILGAANNNVCDKIVLNEALSRELAHALVIDASTRGTLYIDGLSRQARDAVTNDVHISATPEIGVVRALWILLIIPILTRRLVIPRRTLTETTVLAARGEYDIERPVIPISHTMLNLDAGLLVAAAVSVIWYIVAVYTSLPPQPTYPSYYVVAILTAVTFIEVLGTTIALAALVYESRWSHCMSQSLLRCFSCLCPRSAIDRVPYKWRSRAPTWLSIMNRNGGNLLGLFTLMYAIWWDTSDTYNWGLLVAFGMIACILLVEHSALSWMVACQLRSIGLVFYSMLVTAAFFLLFVFQLYDIWLPFFVTLSNGAYTESDLQWIMWAVAAGIVALIVSVAELPVTRVRADLFDRQERFRKTSRSSIQKTK